MGMGRHRREGPPGKAKNPWMGLKRLLPWIAPYWGTILFGLVCMLITTYLQLQPQRLVGYVVDTVLGKGQYQQGVKIALLMLAIFLVTGLFNFLRTYWMHVAGQRLLHTLRVRVYEHLQNLSLTYYDSRQTGDLMSRATGDVEQVQYIIEHGLDIFLMGIFGMVLTFFYIWRISPVLALTVLIPIPVIAVSIFIFSQAIRKIYRTIRDRVGDLYSKLQDNFTGIRVIKAFGREAIETEHVTGESNAVLGMNIRAIRMWASFGPFMGFMSNLGSALVIIAGASALGHVHLTPGQFATCWLFVGGFYAPIGNLFQFFDNIQRALAAGERIFEVLDTVPEIEDPDQPLPLEHIEGAVEFRHVSFRYATGEEVLHDISLTAKPGERVALVGRSGAGKSSFINLIPRFYDVLEGCVLVEGVDVRHVRQADLRQHIALVLQETFLFNGTIRENLRFGKPDATDDELISASITANAHEFIERLPNGYDTEIGERGVKLSGGQRQRLSIARAVLADPRILILDEATSSVDSESEFLIHQALEQLMEGRTTFVIAHRLSTIKHADTILVLEDGQIAERGSHVDLVTANGLYAQMYRQQFWLDELFKEELPDQPRICTAEDEKLPTIE